MNKKIFNPANFLTFLRILFVPAIVYGIISDKFILSFAFLVLSNITDSLDGYVARKLKVDSDFGEYFDFIADFLVIYAAFVSLVLKGQIGLLNISLMIVGTVSLIFLSIMISRLEKKEHALHKASRKVMIILLFASLYLYLLNVSFSDLFMLFSFVAIFFYTIPDYTRLIIEMKIERPKHAKKRQ